MPGRRHELPAYAVPRVRRSRELSLGWDLTQVEQPGLIHAYPILPLAPEARPARRQTLESLR